MISLMTDIFIHLRLLDILDILLVATLFYSLYRLLRGSSAITIFISIVAIIILGKIFVILEMELISMILGAFVNVGLIALIVIFQPEIRRFLLELGNTRFAIWFRNFFSRIGYEKENNDTLSSLDSICEACVSMSEGRVGALILLSQENNLQLFVNTGVVIDAIVSKPLIENIFFKNSPLHDGAMIIKGNKIVAARCILPVSDNRNLPGSFGLRHRAGIGVTETNDCIAIVVSEETGSIRVIYDTRVFEVKPAEMKAKIQELSKLKRPKN